MARGDIFRQSPFRARLPKSPFYIQFPPQEYPITSVCGPATGSMFALGGQTEKNSVRAYVFRFALELGHCSTQSACLKRANIGSREPHSIT
jgi:hypothetical protein